MPVMNTSWISYSPGPSIVSNSGFTASRLVCSGCGDDTVTISAVCLVRVKPVFLPTGSVMMTASLPRMRKQLCPYQRNSAIGAQSFQCLLRACANPVIARLQFQVIARLQFQVQG